jgi:hypothetical protein
MEKYNCFYGNKSSMGILCANPIKILIQGFFIHLILKKNITVNWWPLEAFI